LPEDEKSYTQITRAAGVVASGTLASRILGLFRDVIIAMKFPAATSCDAFVVAFRIPNLLRRLFGEGGLNAAFVPVFSEYLSKKGRNEAFELASVVLSTLAVVLAVISAAGIVLSPLIVKIQVWGWAAGATPLGPDKLWLTSLLLRLMFPYIILICLTALSAAMLNTMKHFASGAFAPALLNISLILSALFLGRYFEQPVIALAIGVLAGGLLQLLLQVPPLLRRHFSFRPLVRLSHPGLRRIALLMLPAAVGFGVAELNTYVDMFLASFLAPGSNSFLYFANRLVQLPLALFGIAVATPILPRLSILAAKRETTQFARTVIVGVRLVAFFALPSMAGLILLRRPIVNLLFQRGSFSEATTEAVAYTLAFYALGLFAFAAVKVFASAFYAHKDTKTPVKAGAVAMLANVVLNIILMQFFAYAGLAFASSISSFINLAILLVIARKSLGVRPDRTEALRLFKTALATLLMAAGCIALLSLVGYNLEASFADRLLRLAAILLGSVAIFGVSSRLLGCQELHLLLSSFTRRHDRR